MANKYAEMVDTPGVTPQSRPIPGEETVQVQNNAGGYVYDIDKWSRLERFVILGTEGGTYYVNERELTLDNVKSLKECIAEDPRKAAGTISQVSLSGRAFRNDAAEFALAQMVIAGGEARKAAYDFSTTVLRTGRTWLEWQSLLSKMGLKWNRSRRTSVEQWYASLTPEDMAYQVIKYQRGGDYTHADIVRLAHPRTLESEVQRKAIYAYLRQNGKFDPAVLPAAIEAWEKIKAATTEAEVCGLIVQYKLTWEFVPNQWLGKPAVWRVLLPNLPYTALMRNLGRLTANGVLAPLSDEVQLVTDKLTSDVYIAKSRVHPMSLLIAQRTYRQGHGNRAAQREDALKWTPNATIVAALEAAFYAAFDAVEPSGKRMLIGIDCSASMDAPASGLPITCSEAAAVMAMVSIREERSTYVMRFNQGIQHVDINATWTLDQVLKYIRQINGGGTDCSLPMVWALQNKIKVDQFVVLTDNETWAGRIHPKQALAQYRQESGIPSRQVVVGMTSTGFSIADPADPLTLDVVGLDTSTPALISRFSAGL